MQILLKFSNYYVIIGDNLLESDISEDTRLNHSWSAYSLDVVKRELADYKQRAFIIYMMQDTLKVTPAMLFKTYPWKECLLCTD